MPMFTVDDRCIKCGLCATLCPAKIIHFEKGETPFVPEEREKACIRCGQCVSFCPKSCCYLSFQDQRTAVDNSLMPDTAGAETFLRSRRSIRRYQEEPVDDETIRRIIETARYAPSASNSQPVRWIVLPTRKKVLEIGEHIIAFFRSAAAENPDDKNARMYAGLAKAWENGEDIVFRGAPQLVVAVVDQSHYFPEDAAFALTYFELAAHANGVGCCWGGFFTMAARKSADVQEALGVSKNEFIAGAQMFGYPAHGPSHLLPPRKKTDITWF